MSKMYCSRKKNCDRDKNHPGNCSKGRTVPNFWDTSPVLKKKKMDKVLNKIDVEIMDATNSKDELIVETSQLLSTKSTLEEETCELVSKKITLEEETIELISKNSTLKEETVKLCKYKLKVEKKFNSLKLLIEQKSPCQSQRKETTLESIRNSGNSNRYDRQKETKMLLEHIHGGDMGALYGAWDFLISTVNRLKASDIFEKLILDHNKGKWFEKLYGKFGDIYNQTEDGINKALARKYSLHLSRRRYIFMCRLQKATINGKNNTISYGDRNIELRQKPISHDTVMKFVNGLDIGDIHSISNTSGGFRTVTALITMVIDLHLKTPSLREKLVWYNSMENHFICEFSDDGAPETRDLTMCIGSLSFWNFGGRIRSRDFQYPLHMLSAKEKDEAVANLWHQHTDEMAMLEGNILIVNNERVTIEFQPSADQAWQFFANNELTQSATWFSMYAKIHKSDVTLIGGTIGDPESAANWKTPTAATRAADLKKLDDAREGWAPLGLSDDNIHKRELAFMAESGLRQIGPPRIGIFADRQRPDPLHLEVNNWEHVLDLIYLTAVQHDVFQEFVDTLAKPVVDGGCGEKFVAHNIVEHFNSNDRFKKLPTRLIGAQAIALARYSDRLTDILIQKADGLAGKKVKALALSKICEYLRKIGTLMNKISVDNTTIAELSESCRNYFNLFSLFFNDACNSTVWTLGYVVSYHADLLYTTYKVGYGILSMQGKEAKHSAIKQELKSGTNRSTDDGEKGKWHQMFKSSFVRDFYLPFHFPLDSYRPHHASRNPPVNGHVICNCYRQIDEAELVCSVCTNSFNIIESAKNGKLTDDLYVLLYPVKCTKCDKRFPDEQIMLGHVTQMHTEVPIETSTAECVPSTMSIAELRSELGRRQKSTTGKKSALAARLESAIMGF